MVDSRKPFSNSTPSMRIKKENLETDLKDQEAQNKVVGDHGKAVEPMAEFSAPKASDINSMEVDEPGTLKNEQDNYHKSSDAPAFIYQKS